MLDDLQDIVESAADLLQAPATLEDRDFHLVAYAAHGRTIDPVRTDSILHRRATREVRTRFERHGIARASGPVRIPADPPSGVLARLCLPVRWSGVTYGYLWLLDNEGITDALAARAAPLTERAALLMARQARDHDDRGWKLADLLSLNPEIRNRAATDLTGVIAPPYAVAVLRTPEPNPLNPWLLPRSVLATIWEGEHVLLTTPTHASHTIERARDQLRERGGTPVRAGVHAPCPTLTGVRDAWRKARVAARTAPDDHTRDWDSLGALRLLHCADETALTEAVTPPTLAGLLTHDLAHTARTFLDEAGSVQRTARTLSIHRQTLYARLARIEDMTGLTFTSGQDRLTLHLALTLHPHVTGP